MHFLLITFFLFLASVFSFNQPEITELRRLLNEGKENEQAAEALFKLVGNYRGQEPLLMGYSASAHALQAKYLGNPFKKLDHLKTSSRLFSQGLAKEPKNLELRFMRYAVEAQTPSFLGYSEHVTEDKNVLVEALRRHPGSGFSPETARVARDYLLENCDCTGPEKEFLEHLKL